MSSFLRSLIAGGHVPFCVDYRTGSIQSLSGAVAGTAPTVTNTPKFQRTAKGMAADFRTGYLTYPHQADQILTQATWMFVFENDSAPADYKRILCKRSAVGTAYDFYMYPSGSTTVMGYYQGVSTYSLGVPAGRTRTVCWSHVGGQIPELYANGVRLGSLITAGTIGTAAVPIVVGALYNGSQMFTRPLPLVAVVNVVLSPAEVARLHRELTAAPGIVARARKGFSIPYPVKTPSEYAAEGITFDTALQKVGNVAVANVGTSGTFQTGAQVDREATSGPFDGAVRMSGHATFGTTQGDPVPGTGSFAYSTWVRIDRAPATGSYFAGKYSAFPLWYMQLDTSRRLVIRARNALGTVTSPGSIVLPTQAWMNVWYVLNRTTNRMISYVNGIETHNVDVAALGAGTMTNGNTFDIGKNALVGDPFPGAIAKGTFWNREVTLADARKEYLEGARKCLLDARIHSDGSCPVSLAAVGAGNEIANGWKVQSGTWKVVEDAPSGGRAGKRWLASQTGATLINTKSTAAYGSFPFRLRKPLMSRTQLIGFISANGTGTIGADNGYYVVITNAGSIGLNKITAGAGSAIIPPTAAGVIQAGIECRFWPTRRVDGLFSLWVRGGLLTSWTLVGTGTDTTFTTSKYAFLQNTGAGAGDDDFGGIVSYTGEMTPSEAIARGLIDP